MTAQELVQAFESSGGKLMIDGGDVRFFCPKDAYPLVDLIRHQRDGVLEIMHLRAMEAVLLGSQALCMRLWRRQQSAVPLPRVQPFRMSEAFALTHNPPDRRNHFSDHRSKRKRR